MSKQEERTGRWRRWTDRRPGAWARRTDASWGRPKRHRRRWWPEGCRPAARHVAQARP